MGAEFVGVDLLPVGDGWTLLELNGAVEFTRESSLREEVFAAVARRLGRLAARAAPPFFDEPVELRS